MTVLKKPWLQLLIIAAMALLAYANTFQAPFAFDDLTSIVDNPVIKDLSFFLDGEGYRYNSRRFVGSLSVAINYALGGLDVSGYHIFNLAVHVCSGFLVYILLRLTLMTPFFRGSDADEKQAAMREGAPFIAGILFVLHPVQTQAVTYIIQRLASLAALFYLLSLVLYVAGRMRQLDGRGRAAVISYCGALLSALLAFKTKEIAFTLPFAIVLFECFFFGISRRKLLLLAAPLLLCLTAGLLVLGNSGGVGHLLSDITEKTRLQTDMPRQDYLFTQFRVLVTYLRLIIFPAGQNLDYDYQVYHSLLSPPVLLSLLLLLGLLGVAVYLFFRSSGGGASSSRRGSDRIISFGIIWFFLTLSIESSLIPIEDVIFEHRLYLPMAGVALAAGALVSRLLVHSPRWGSRAALAALVLVLAGLTWQRNAVWRDGYTLWSDTVAKSPAKARPHLNLGKELMLLGRVDEAIPHFQTAARIRPDLSQAYCNLGAAYNSKGLYDMAITQLQTALRIAPDNADALNNLGTAFALRGEPQAGISYFKAALSIAPENEQYRYNLTVATQEVEQGAAAR